MSCPLTNVSKSLRGQSPNESRHSIAALEALLRPKTKFKPLAAALIKPPVADIGKVAGDGGSRGHHGTDKMRTPAAALPSFKIAVAGRRATLGGAQNIGIHSEAHRAAGFTPLEAGILENLVQAFLLG